MKFLTTWKIQPGGYNAAVARFLETGGAPPPGVRILHRWHGANGIGAAISESDDAKAIYQGLTQWADVLDMNISPCVEDADAGAALASLGKR